MKQEVLAYFKNDEKISKKELKILFHGRLNDLYEVLSELEKEDKLTYDAVSKVYCLSKSSFFVTTINESKKGSPIIIKDEKKYKLNYKNLLGACPNCEVLMYEVNDTFYVKEILSRENSKFIAELEIIDGKFVFIPYNYKIPFVLNISEKHNFNLVDGDRVLINLRNELYDGSLYGDIIKVIANKKDVDANEVTICHEYDFRTEFSKETIKELENIPTKISEEDVEGRVDLRNECVITIDPVTAKDLDDAFSIYKTESGYVVKTHIADVANYVKLNSSIFKDAIENSTSVYLGKHVVPMLPHELSSGICSLTQNEDRLTRTVEIYFDNEGKEVDFKTYKSVIRSRKKMNYVDVQKIFDGKMVEGYEEYSDILNLTKELAIKLNSQRENRGYLHFLSNEINFDYNSSENVCGAKMEESTLSHQYIENIMILSNHFKILSFGSLPIIYRNHPMPDSIKIKEALEKLKNLDINYDLSNPKLNKKTLQRALVDLSKEDSFLVISKIILKSFEKAFYSTINEEHFGLSLDVYSHTTSPIRRIVDLMVQISEDFYNRENITNNDITFLEDMLINVAGIASKKELDAVKAENKFTQLEMAKYMNQYVGSDYRMLISEINDDYIYLIAPGMAEGRIKYSKKDYDYIPKRNCLKDKYGHKYKVGHNLLVKLMSINNETGEMDYFMIENLSIKNKAYQRIKY